MALPTVTMQSPAGVDVPSIIYLNDGSTVRPAANGQITISSKFLNVMLAAGWQIVVNGGTTHVP